MLQIPIRDVHDVNINEALIPAAILSRGGAFCSHVPTIYGAAVVKTTDNALEFVILQEYVDGLCLQSHLDRMIDHTLSKNRVIGECLHIAAINH